MTRIIARNSAPISTNSPAALKNARIRNSTECTGLRAETTITPEAIATAANKASALALIDGQAGTGKRYTMAGIREAYEAGGYRVVGLAPTNAVAQDMQRDGFRHART